MGSGEALEEKLDEVQLQLVGLAEAIAKQRGRIERTGAAAFDRSEAEATLASLVEARQALAERYRQLLKEVG
jgi:hypothetical protein